MRQQSYFEQFSGYKPTDDTWWDKWAVVRNGFIHREYDSEAEAASEIVRISEHYPHIEATIVHIEKAGFEDMRYKSLGMPIFPIDIGER